MATPAKKDSAPKAERKKPVRKAPVQKDYPSKLAWLAALVEYETKQTEAGNAHRVERLDKRIAAKKEAIAKLDEELDALQVERFKLVSDEEQDTEPAEELVDGMTDEEHLAAEGKA